MSFTALMQEAGELPCQSAPQLFFETDGRDDTDAVSTPARYKMAKALCNDCPIRMQCLSYAIEHNIPHGVWGQTTPQEREWIRKA